MMEAIKYVRSFFSLVTSDIFLESFLRFQVKYVQIFKYFAHVLHI